MKGNYFLRLFSIVLAVHTIQDGLIVCAANAHYKGMELNGEHQGGLTKQISNRYNVVCEFGGEHVPQRVAKIENMMSKNA